MLDVRVLACVHCEEACGIRFHCGLLNPEPPTANLPWIKRAQRGIRSRKYGSSPVSNFEHDTTKYRTDSIWQPNQQFTVGGGSRKRPRTVHDDHGVQLVRVVIAHRLTLVLFDQLGRKPILGTRRF